MAVVCDARLSAYDVSAAKRGIEILATQAVGKCSTSERAGLKHPGKVNSLCFLFFRRSYTRQARKSIMQPTHAPTQSIPTFRSLGRRVEFPRCKLVHMAGPQFLSRWRE